MNRIYLLLSILALAGCSLFNSPPVQAGTVTVTWTNPLTNTDGSAIAPTQGDPEALQVWRIEYGTCAAGNTFGTKIGEFSKARLIAGPPLTSATNNVPAGPKCFRVYVANSQNESAASNVSARDVPFATPGPVTNVAAALASS